MAEGGLGQVALNPSSPVTGVVLTFNEEANLERCLASMVPAVREILVVDSGSTDRTLEIAERFGARVLHHPFVGHASQWAFALSQPHQGTWVLGLDADQQLSPELTASLAEQLSAMPTDVEGVYVNRLHVFRGTPLRHGGLFPKWMLKVFRSGRAFTDDSELLDHHFYVRGKTARLRGLLLEDNRKERDISFWMRKHIAYAERQAQEEFDRSSAHHERWALQPSLWGSPSRRVLWLKRIWYGLPLYLRPFLYFSYRYFLRLGLLDGRQGLLFHFFHALWFRLLVDVHLDGLRSARRKATVGGTSSATGRGIGPGPQ